MKPDRAPAGRKSRDDETGPRDDDVLARVNNSRSTGEYRLQRVRESPRPRCTIFVQASHHGERLLPREHVREIYVEMERADNNTRCLRIISRRDTPIRSVYLHKEKRGIIRSVFRSRLNQLRVILLSTCPGFGFASAPPSNPVLRSSPFANHRYA